MEGSQGSQHMPESGPELVPSGCRLPSPVPLDATGFRCFPLARV